MKLELIAARARNGVIGRGLTIPWQAKGEQKLFKDITMGGTLIMGRLTFESIGKALPGRQTIIVSRDATYQQPGCETANSLQEALTLAEAHWTRDGTRTFIAGGGNLYAQALKLTQTVHLTTIEVTPKGDVFFPEFPTSEFTLVAEQHFSTNLNYTYQQFERTDTQMESK